MNPSEFPKIDLPVSFIITNEVTPEILQYYQYFPCKIKACIFVLCTQGKIEAVVNMTKQTIEAGSLVTLLPNSFIQIEHCSDDIKLYTLGFSSEFMIHSHYMRTAMGYFYRTTNKPSLKIPPRVTRLYEQGCQLLMRSDAYGVMHQNDNMVNAIFNLCIQICINLYSHYLPVAKEHNCREGEIYQEFITTLTRYYNKEHNVQFYAQACNVTLQHFCATIKRASGHTALDIIRHFLIVNAKELLYTTNKPIKEIAFELGFTTSSHFNRFFREQTGMTPLQFRNKRI